MKKLLEINNLVVVYETNEGTVEALDHVNLAIEKAELVSLIGESGCGKSTLAKAILGVIPSPGKVTAGEILFNGQDILLQRDAWIHRQIRGTQIALIPQNPLSSLNPVFRIGTQIRDICKRSFRGRESPNSDILKANTLRLLNRVQLSPGLLSKLPGELSGGERQRILIVIALLLNPVFLIADEPTTALDVTTEAQILELLKKLAVEEKISVLYITHDLAVAGNIGERVVVMYAGQVVESAPSNIFFENTAHPYSVKLLSCLPNPEGTIQDIPGRVPNLIDPPQGCRFAPRCDRRLDKCEGYKPPKTGGREKHWVYCYNPYWRPEKANKH